MSVNILLSIISSTYTLQTMYDLNEKIKTQHSKAIADLIDDSVEHSYITYIYDMKQKCKRDGAPIVYDVNKAHQIANEYFYTNYSKPLFSRTNTININKRIKDQLRFYRAKTQAITSSTSA